MNRRSYAKIRIPSTIPPTQLIVDGARSQPNFSRFSVDYIN